jgi:hypothetical protein
LKKILKKLKEKGFNGKLYLRRKDSIVLKKILLKTSHLNSIPISRIPLSTLKASLNFRRK